MIWSVKAGSLTIRGVSVGGVYTSLYVPELGVMFDVGASPRSFAGAGALLLSHGHPDHAGALPAFLGIRALHGKTSALRVYLPAEIVAPLQASLAAQKPMVRYGLEIDPVPMEPGDVVPFKGDLSVRAFKTFHPVPSLGYELSRRVLKLKPEHAHLRGPEIALRRRAGEPLFDEIMRREVAYVTDTLIRVVHTEPELLSARVLILECTFLDDRKSLAATHAGCHIHLDELLEIADRITCEHLVLMHFSQLYRPPEVVEILRRRLPPELMTRVVPFVPEAAEWPG